MFMCKVIYINTSSVTLRGLGGNLFRMKSVCRLFHLIYLRRPTLTGPRVTFVFFYFEYYYLFNKKPIVTVVGLAKVFNISCFR